MQPYDGHGFGKSIYWTWQAASIGRQNGEACFCWDEAKPTLEIKPDVELTIKVTCAAKSLYCRNDFPKTEEKLKELFKEFYKV